VGKRKYSINADRKLWCYHRKRYICHRDIVEDLKAGIDIEVERHANFEPFVDVTEGVLKNILAHQLKMSIQALNKNQLIKRIISTSSQLLSNQEP